jgi:hypothetical protein
MKEWQRDPLEFLFASKNQELKPRGMFSIKLSPYIAPDRR